MTQAFATAFRRLLRADGEDRALLARDLVRREVPWSRWLEAFNAVYGTRPEAEACAATALAAAAGRARRPQAAARFRLLAGRGLQRASSPARAARVLARAAEELRRAGDPLRADQAEVLLVDALAVAGRPQEALALAERTRRRLAGPGRAPWRAAVDINRANALRVVGKLGEAVRVYEAAARALVRAGDPHTAAIAWANAGTTWIDAGDAHRARRWLERARDALRSQGHTDMVLEVENNLAAAEVRDGHLGAGLRRLEGIARTAAKRGLDRREALASLDLADALSRAGDRVEAERRALAAAESFRRAGAVAEAVEALWVAAAAAVDAPARAARHLRRAARAARAAGLEGLLLRCRLLDLDLALRRGRPVDARTLAGVRRRAEALGQAEVAAECGLFAGHLALVAGRHREAEARFADPVFRRPGRPWLWAAAETGRARAQAVAGHPGAAIRRLGRVSEFLDRVRAGLPGPWLRTAFVLERLDPYLTRVDLLLERGDRAEAEALLDALAARRFLEGRRTRGGRGLAALRARLEGIYDRLAKGSGPVRGLAPGEHGRLALEAKGLEREVAELWRREERRHRPAASVGTAHPSRAPLPSGRTVLHVWLRGEEVLGLARRGEDVVAHASLGDRGGLARALSRLGFHAARAARSRVGRAAFDAALADLGRRLARPLRPGAWTRQVHLVLDPRVPDVPWEILLLEGRAAPPGTTVCRVPAARVDPVRPSPGHGVAVVALGEPDLPAVAREAAGVARGTPVEAGAAATRGAVARALATRAVVHVAGHGFEAEEAPGLAGVRVADGWFGIEDLPRRIAARLVVLAACRTGRESTPAALAWGGLPMALLAAGARHVVWTADDVEDDVTADLMERFHARLGASPVPLAYAEAIRACHETRGSPAPLLPFRLSGVPSRRDAPLHGVTP